MMHVIPGLFTRRFLFRQTPFPVKFRDTLRIYRTETGTDGALHNAHNALLVEVDHVSADQSVENIVVKLDAFASAGAFHVLEEIDRGIAGVTYCAVSDSPNDLLELLLLPSAVARVRESPLSPSQNS